MIKTAHHLLSVLAIFLSSCGAAPGIATVPEKEAGKSVSVKLPDREIEDHEIRRLIEALASKNERPEPYRRGIRIPPGWNPTSQEAVYTAADALIAKGPAAFRSLIAAFDDKRFSFTQDSPSSGVTRIDDVGFACMEIIACQLEVYEKLGLRPVGFPSYFRDVVIGPGGRQREEYTIGWFDAHREMSLLELQIEATEWAISEQEKLLETQEFEAWREENFREVVARNAVTLGALKASKIPITPKRNFPIHDH